MTKGLPGSGKSTWAKKVVLDNKPGSVVRINKDDLRKMLNAGRHKGKTEQRVVRARNALVQEFLSSGVSVIVDDTNFNPAHETVLRNIAKDLGVQFEVIDFTDVPIETCIKNDLKRPESVGEAVIRKMHAQYLAEVAEPPAFIPGAPSAVLVDIDGTIARMVSRTPFEWDRVHTDEPVETVVRLVQDLYESGEEIIFMSGRDSVCYGDTVDWIEKHVGIDSGSMYMRAEGDTRKDAVVKRELYETYIKGKYNVRFVLDDRNQVVDMWRSLGLTCLQVAPGAF